MSEEWYGLQPYSPSERERLVSYMELSCYSCATADPMSIWHPSRLWSPTFALDRLKAHAGIDASESEPDVRNITERAM